MSEYKKDSLSMQIIYLKWIICMDKLFLLYELTDTLMTVLKGIRFTPPCNDGSKRTQLFFINLSKLRRLL